MRPAVGAGETERGERGGRGQDETRGHGGDDRGRTQHEHRGGLRLGGETETVPEGGRLLAQRARGDAAEVEDDDGVIAVADEDIDAAQRFGEGAGADPDEMAEMVRGMIGGGETVGGVDEGDTLPAGARVREEGFEHEAGAAAGRGRDELGEASGGEAAAEGRVNRRDAGGHAGPPGGGGRGRPCGHEGPQRGDGGGWRHGRSCLQADIRRTTPTTTPCDSIRAGVRSG